MIEGFARNLYACYFVPWMGITSRYPVGENIFDSDWDLCVILDACRIDALQEVSSEFDFINDVGSKISLGSSSKEWMVNTFREQYREEASNTVYLTGNGWAEIVLSDDPSFSRWTVTDGSFAQDNPLVENIIHRPTLTEEDFEDVVYQPFEDLNGISAPSAELLTDMAIQTSRESDPSRTIVHYMQPHEPYLHRVSEGKEPTQIDKKPIELLRDGHDQDEIWGAYLDNLRYVLSNVETLLNNISGEVLITADHGEMLGNHLSGHGEGILHPRLKRVPWVRATATDEHTRSPSVDIEPGQQNAKDAVDDRLEALGYL